MVRMWEPLRWEASCYRLLLPCELLKCSYILLFVGLHCCHSVVRDTLQWCVLACLVALSQLVVVSPKFAWPLYRLMGNPITQQPWFQESIRTWAFVKVTGLEFHFAVPRSTAFVVGAVHLESHGHEASWSCVESGFQVN
jgi:hypothetical protein